MLDKFIEQFNQVDLSAPDATWQLIMLMLNSLPWKFVIWYTVIGLIGGILIGWYKKTLWRDIWISLLLGPPGWIVSLILPASRRKCSACGYQNRTNVKLCKQCGTTLVVPATS